MYSLLIVIIGILCLNNADSYVVKTRRDTENTTTENSNQKYDPKAAEKAFHVLRKQFGLAGNSLDSIVLAIDTGVKQFFANSGPDVIDKIGQTIAKLAKSIPTEPLYRSRASDYIKPEVVHFRSEQKPALMFEINSKSVINAMKDLLQSKTINKYMEKFSKDAAVVYRALKDEIDRHNVDRQ